MYDEISRELARMRRDNPQCWRSEAEARAEAWEISAGRQPDSIVKSMHVQRAATWRRAIASAAVAI